MYNSVVRPDFVPDKGLAATGTATDDNDFLFTLTVGKLVEAVPWVEHAPDWLLSNLVPHLAGILDVV